MKLKKCLCISNSRSAFSFKALLITLLMACSVESVATPQLQTNRLMKVFEADSLSKIKELHAGYPFILIVWSVDCLPCRQEFDMLREIKNTYPKLRLSLVAIESTQDVPQVFQIISEHQLLKEDNWAFAETNSAKLRYALDPTWYGELPRAYFYNKQHSRVAVSGKLPKTKVIGWLSQVSSTKKKISP